jgi:subtilisin family serine protease
MISKEYFSAIFLKILVVLGLFLLCTSQLLVYSQDSLPIDDETGVDQITASQQKNKTAENKADLNSDEKLEQILENLGSNSPDIVPETLLVKVKEDRKTENRKEKLISKLENPEKTKNFFEDLFSNFGLGENEKKEIEVISQTEDTLILDLGDQSENAEKELIKDLMQDENVEIVQPLYNYKSFYIPNDPMFTSQQWGYRDQGSATNVQSAWDTVGSNAGFICGETTNGKRCGGNPNIKIAVIDSGINTAVSDFAGANFDNANSIRFYNQSNNTCPAGEYYQSFNIGGNFLNFCRKVGSQFDEVGHGTKVTSTIAMQDNSTGGLGVAYNTTILPIAVHGQAFNTFFIAESVRHAAASGARVINLSLGTPFYDSYLEDAINEVTSQGVIVVAASGNCAIWTTNCDWDGNNVQTPGYFAEVNNAVMYPAGFGNVIAVGASDYNATTGGVTRSDYSNFGAHLDIVAPVGDSNPSSPSGVLIQCGVTIGVCASNDSFVLGKGTSYAAPQVAGIVGLMLSINNSLDFAGVQSILSQTAKDVGSSGFDTQFGHGLIDASGAVNLIGANFVPTHYFPWYETNNGHNAYTLIGNPSTTQNVRVRVQIGNNEANEYRILGPGKNMFYQKLAIGGKPVTVYTDGGVPVYATQRTDQIINGRKSFNEFPGIVASTLTNRYYFPWYDTKNGNSSFIITGNPSTTQTANIQIKIAGNTVRTASIAPGTSLPHITLGILGGPVEVISDINVYASQQTNQLLNGYYSFNEYGGISQSTLTNKYFFPWYDTLPGNEAYTLIGNPSTTQTANIQIKIAGNVVRTGTIAPGANLFHQSVGILGGPVEVTSDINVYASQRVHQRLGGFFSFSEYNGISN